MERSSAECTEVSMISIGFRYGSGPFCTIFVEFVIIGLGSSTINQASSGLAPYAHIFINQAPLTRLHQPFIQSILGGLSFIDLILFVPLTFSLGL